MESEIGKKDHTLAQTFGVISGLALAGLLTTLSLSALDPTNGSYAGIGLMFAAIGIGAPLALLTLVITGYLAGKGALGLGLFSVIWLPVLASLAIIPISESSRKKEKTAYESAHPSVNEIHVNLTGRELRLDPLIGGHAPTDGKQPAHFVSFKREPVDNRGDKMAAYRGLLPAPDFKSMPVIYGPSEQGEAVSVPVSVAPIPAAWAPYLPELGTRLANRLHHYYYHYPDRVEVASAIDWGDENTPEPDSGKPATGVYLHNLSGGTVVRVEVNGETLAFYEGLPPLRGGDDCRIIRSSARLAEATKLKVRWQTAQSAGEWKEATPAVSTFRTPHPASGTVVSTSLHLFLQPDGGVTVQRAQEYITTRQGKGVRESAALPAFKTAPACGTAMEYYPEWYERSAD